MNERYAFIAEWYDPNASLIRRYQLLFYPGDSSVEMFDIKNCGDSFSRGPNAST